MNKTMVLPLLLLTATLAGCTDDTASADTAVICTNYGPLVLDLYTERTPGTVSNFVNLAKSGYYDGVVFHRIITDFMMQGGDPTGTGRGGEAFGGGNIKDELDDQDGLTHATIGAVSMAKTSAPDSGSSQFFIVFDPSDRRAPTHLDGVHTIFGQVTQGLDILQTIEDVAASSTGTPREDVFMHTVLVDGDPSACPDAQDPPEPVPPFACPTSEARAAMSPIDADAITPGLLCITMTEDATMVWARNRGDGDATITWSLTGPDGGALPDGWTVSFDDATGTVGSHKSNQEATYTMLRIEVPDGTNGTFPVELHTGVSTTDLTAYVDLRHDELSEAGDAVELHYKGTCKSNGEQFDASRDRGQTFTATAGRISGQGATIPGFAFGIVGLGESESVYLDIPATLAYGYSGGPCAGDDADLIFEIDVVDL